MRILKGFLILSFLFLILFFLPLKISVKKETLNNEIRSFIVESAETTGPNWYLKEDSKKLLKADYVVLAGNPPDKRLNSGFFIDSDNKFKIYGKVIGKYYESSDETYNVIYVDKWDIVYPVDRGGTLNFITPKSYLSIMDFIFLRYYEYKHGRFTAI